MPLRSESFDLVVCADLVEHLYPDQFESMLDECFRVLKPGGRVVIWTPNPGHFFEVLKRRNIILRRDESHVDYKTMGRLVEALRRHRFQVLSKRYTESHFPVLRTIERALLRFVPILRRRLLVLAMRPALGGATRACGAPTAETQP